MTMWLVNSFEFVLCLILDKKGRKRSAHTNFIQLYNVILRVPIWVGLL